MINQLLTVLHYTGLFALCLPSLFFIVSIFCLTINPTNKKNHIDLALFWAKVCIAEYLLALGIEYVGGVL